MPNEEICEEDSREPTSRFDAKYLRTDRVGFLRDAEYLRTDRVVFLRVTCGAVSFRASRACRSDSLLDPKD